MAIEVVYTIPSSGQGEVYIDDPIKIKFNKELLDTSFTNENFSLRKSDGTGRLYGTLGKDPDDPTIVIFNPDSNHDPNTQYRFTIRGDNPDYGIVGIESVDSDNMSGNYYFDYRVSDQTRPYEDPPEVTEVYDVPEMIDTDGDGIPDTLPHQEGDLFFDARIPIPIYPGNMPHLYEGDHIGGSGTFELITGIFGDGDGGGYYSGIYSSGLLDVERFRVDHTDPAQCQTNVLALDDLTISFNQDINIGDSLPENALVVQRVPIWLDDAPQDTLVENIDLSDDYIYNGQINPDSLNYSFPTLASGLMVDSEYIITLLPGMIRSAATGEYNIQEEIRFMSYITVRYATVPQIRYRLPSTVNAAFDDCQIDRVIAEESRFLYDYLGRPDNLTPRQQAIANRYIVCVVTQLLQNMFEEERIAQWDGEREEFIRQGRETVLARLANIGVKSRKQFGLEITYDTETLKAIASDPGEYSSGGEELRPFDSKARKCCEDPEDCYRWLNMLDRIVGTRGIRTGIKSGSTIKYPGRRRGVNKRGPTYEPTLPLGGPNEDRTLGGA